MQTLWLAPVVRCRGHGASPRWLPCLLAVYDGPAEPKAGGRAVRAGAIEHHRVIPCMGEWTQLQISFEHH